MLSVSRRNFLSLTAATAVATALTTQAAHANTGMVLNGEGLNSGVLRFTPWQTSTTPPPSLRHSPTLVPSLP